MAISKQKKQELVKLYESQLKSAASVVVIKQSWLPVNEQNKLRMQIKKAGGVYQITKKRLLVRTIAETDYENIELWQLDGSIALLYANDEATKLAPLKALNTIIKSYKKEQLPYTIEFVWWWFDKQRWDAQAATEMANLPSKEELISKLMRLMKYPVQAFASVTDQVAKNKQ